MTVLSVYTPAPVRMPRGAPVAAALFGSFLQLVEAAGRVLRASRQAAKDQRQTAERMRQARELRQFALCHAGDDPRFAADLLAAADRHELQG